MSEKITREKILGYIFNSKFEEQQVIYELDLVKVLLGRLVITLSERDMQIHQTDMVLAFAYSGLKDFYSFKKSDYRDRDEITIVYEDLQYPEEENRIKIPFGSKLEKVNQE